MTINNKTRALRTGNSKLGKDVPVFNLQPMATCPGRTKGCAGKSGYCYACHGNYLYPSHMVNWKNNKAFANSRHFVPAMVRDIAIHKSRVARKGESLRVRLHSTGDFYSQRYLNNWIKVANEHPDVQFLAYTRSHMLDFSSLPDNFKVYYSIDDTTEAMPITLRQYAEVVPADHTARVKGRHICQSECHKCKACWAMGWNVAFRMH